MARPPKPEGTIKRKISISLTPNTYTMLQVLAATYQCSRSEVIEQLLEERILELGMELSNNA